jgi:hypothetical protein
MTGTPNAAADLAVFLDDLAAGRRIGEWQSFVATHYNDPNAERIRGDLSRLAVGGGDIESFVGSNSGRLRAWASELRARAT